MYRIVTALTMIACTCGLTFGQEEPGPNFEHLKSYGPFIGTWRYEGPLLEDVPGFAEKGTEFEIQFSWRRILNKNVVEENWMFGMKDGASVSGKALIGWDSSEKQITQGGMDSLGGMGLGTVAVDRSAKSLTLTSRGRGGDGKETTFKGVVAQTGKDTLTWQALERTGGMVEGQSPVYTLKRIKREKREPQ